MFPSRPFRIIVTSLLFVCLFGEIGIVEPKAVKPSIPSTDEKKEENVILSTEDDPFVAPFPNKYRDKFSSPCDSCFNKWYANGELFH